MANLPVIVIFSPVALNLRSPDPPALYETQALDCRSYLTDENLNEILARERPHVIVSVGERTAYPRLGAAPYEIRKRWLHFEEGTPVEQMGEAAFKLFLQNVFEREAGAPPLVSVFTPTHRIGQRIQRPFQSLLRQTYTNWEWVVVEDSDDLGDNFRMLKGLAQHEPRISLHMMHRHSGVIGELKRRACMIAQGDILLELDHDDELTPDALENVVMAFEQFPEAGFVYSDWAEVYEESGNPVNYGAHWAFGYGSYREEKHGDRNLLVTNAPNINPKTIRHIVGIPNHIRAWRRAAYLEIGGYNPEIHVADDYEIILRTFLNTRMVRVPRLGYIQYFNAHGNTQDARRLEIQRLVRCFKEHYDARIHARLLELGVDDYVWDAKAGRSARDLDSIPNPLVEQHCTLLANQRN